jgi:hypothetical protein
MNDYTVLPGQGRVDSRKIREALSSWRALLADPELPSRAVLFNEAAYFDIRIPKSTRAWWGGERAIDISQHHTWERDSESYRVLVPTGGSRRAGTEPCFAGAMLSDALEVLSKCPHDFPNLRHIPSEFGLGEDLWWGEDISGIWSRPRTLEVHRALGRAFGYREDRILRLYPDDWVENNAP